MGMRVLHIETDSFINALRRFQAERGLLRQLRSDRAQIVLGMN